MSIGKSGHIDVDGTNNVRMRINWAETYDIQSNTSVVALNLQFMAVGPYGYYQVTYYLDGSAKVGGQTVKSFSSSAGADPVRGESQDVWYPANGKGPYSSGKIVHNDDGMASVTISADISGFAHGGGQGSGWKCTVSKTVSLTSIPRASTIRATDGYIESAINIAVYRKTNYTHSIKWEFAGLSGYVTETGGTSATEKRYTRESINWAVPDTFYAQIPNAKSGRLTLTCKTYYGSEQIGSAQTTVCTISCNPALCAPDVSGAVEDISWVSLTGDKNVLVRGESTAQCAITAAAKKSATIKSKTVNGQKIPGAIVEIQAPSTGSFIFTVTDSRGFLSTAELKKKVLPYGVVTNNPTVRRLGADTNAAQLHVVGDFWDRNFGAKKNALTLTYQVNSLAPVPFTATIRDGIYEADLEIPGLDYTQQYTISVIARDLISASERKLQLSKSIPVFDWGESDFALHVPLKMNGQQVTGLPLPKMGTDAVRKGYVDNLTSGFLRVASGEIYDSEAPGSARGVGNASVWVNGNGICRLDFCVKITKGGQSGAIFDHGLSRDKIRQIAPDIPLIKPIIGGSFIAFYSNGSLHGELTGFAGYPNPSATRWKLAHVVDETGKIVGIPENKMAVKMYVVGSCYGRIESK